MCNIYNRDRVVKQPEGTKDLFISHINLYNFLRGTHSLFRLRIFGISHKSQKY